MESNGQKRAAIYCRVSTTKQEEETTSLDTQLERCTEYASNQGYLVDAQHTAEGVPEPSE